jgi:hypothetical protein
MQGVQRVGESLHNLAEARHESAGVAWHGSQRGGGGGDG